VRNHLSAAINPGCDPAVRGDGAVRFWLRPGGGDAGAGGGAAGGADTGAVAAVFVMMGESWTVRPMPK